MATATATGSSVAVTAAAVPLDALVREQQDALRVLRDFVDALRDITKDERVDADVRRAIRSAAFPGVGASRASDGDNDTDLARFTLGMQALLARLSATMKRIDEAEAEQKKKNENTATLVRPASDQRPPAPAGLLSLRDYSVLQAALEVFFCWSVFPCVDVGLLLPLERRRPTKTLDISRYVLVWGSHAVGAATARVVDVEDAGRRMLTATRAMLQVLLLPQTQPILLPKYVVEVVALLVHGATNGDLDDATRQHCQQTIASLLRVLPLRLSMTSLRAALGQSSGRGRAVAAFKLRCGQLLAQLLMEDGGVQTTIEMLLGAVDEGNTQARMQVATLVCQCPADVEPAVYAASIARQLRELFDGSNRQNKLLRETAAVLAGEMAARFPHEFDTDFLAPRLKPLLVYDDAKDANATTRAAAATESDVADCVALLHLLICGPPPSAALVLVLAPVFRPLVHLFGFAVASKSFMTAILHDTLIAFIRVLPNAALLLQVAILPVVPPLRSTLVQCGFRRVSMPVADAPRWDPAYVFSPGGSGGISMREAAHHDTADAEHDPSMPLRLAIVATVQLLASKELESSTVVGELFASLLLTYMRVRKSLAGEPTSEASTTSDTPGDAPSSPLAEYEPLTVPRDALGLELSLSLLLAIIESLGPSVLRSAETVLQCLTTVLGMFARAKTSLVDSRDHDASENDEDEDDEVLTVCLGLLMTILEAGASTRSAAEEAELQAMLPVLEDLSQYPRPQIAELATSARASILSRGPSGSSSGASKAKQPTFEQTLRDAAEDLQSALVPLRARGVVTLTKLVRRTRSHRNDAQWTPRITQLTEIFVAHLADSESYVFLAAVQGLAALSDAHPEVAIPLLTANLRDKSNSLETRIKLSEALLFAAKRCGDSLPTHAKVFVYSYLECIRPPPSRSPPPKPFSLIHEIDPNESEAEPSEEEREAHVQAANAALAGATLRASCLSNLAEVCALLQWSLAPFAADVLSCVFGILELELDMSAHSVVAVRRGAVFLLKYVLQLMGFKVLEVLPDQLKPLYHTLKHVERVDKDDVVRLHAQQALRALDAIMRAELFPGDAATDGLRALRIVQHEQK